MWYYTKFPPAMRITRQTQLFTIATVNAADLPRCGSSPDVKRLKLPLSPPRARPAGAKPTERARRPTFGQFKHCTTISPTILQPLSNPAPIIGNLNPIHNRPSTATQPRDNHNHAAIVSKSHSSRPKPTDGRSRAWQTSTTQPSFVSKPRTIPTQPLLNLNPTTRETTKLG